MELLARFPDFLEEKLVESVEISDHSGNFSKISQESDRFQQFFINFSYSEEKS